MAIQLVQEDVIHPYIPTMEEDNHENPTTFWFTLMSAKEHSIAEAKMSDQVKMKGRGRNLQFRLNPEAQNHLRMQVMKTHITKIENITDPDFISDELNKEAPLFELVEDSEIIAKIIPKLPPAVFMEVYEIIFGVSDLPPPSGSD